MDEVSFALEENKKILPVLYRDCDIPFRLKRIQHIDFTANYDEGLAQLLKNLNSIQPAQSLEIPEPERKASQPIRKAKSDEVWVPAFIIAIGWAVGGAIGLTIAFNI